MAAMVTTMAALLILSAATTMQAAAAAGLQMDFYSATCPRVEEIVKEEMVGILTAAPTLAGPLLRLHFHDCFVRVGTSLVVLLPALHLPRTIAICKLATDE
jgi:peroxidase